jgi:hypothetical protein
MIRPITYLNKYDFFMTFIFLVSFGCLYVSFLKFNDITKSVTGIYIHETGKFVKQQLFECINKTKEMEMTGHTFTFFEYIWTILQTFSYEVIEIQRNKIRDIVVENLSVLMEDFKMIAEKTCIPRTEVMKEGNYYLTSPIGTIYTDNNIDLGKIVNSVVQFATVITNVQTTSTCITNTALSLQKRAFEELFVQKSLMLNRISAQSSQSIQFLMYGISTGTSCFLYLIFRTKFIIFKCVCNKK